LDFAGMEISQGYVFEGKEIAGVDCEGCFLDVLHNAMGEAVNLVVKVPARGDSHFQDLFLPGAELAGCFTCIGDVNDSIVVVVDYASGVAIHAATGQSVWVAYYDRNLAVVCSTARAAYPGAKLVVAVGARRTADYAAIKRITINAATECGALVAVPTGAQTFRQLLSLRDHAAVRDALDTAGAIPETWGDTSDEPETVPVAWPVPVHPAGLMAGLCAHVARHTALRFESILAIVLWVLSGHFLAAFQIAPILALLSLTRRCGKTSTLSAVTPLVLRPLVTSDITAAGLYHACKSKPTMLIDEADQFINRPGHPIVGVINAGHSRAASMVKRVIGGKLVSFDAFGSKLVSAIGVLPETIADRSIIVPLLRKHRHDKVDRYRSSGNDNAAALRAQIEAFSEDCAGEVSSAKPTPPDLPSDRAIDNWEPLLAVASCAGSGWLQNARQAATALTQADDEVPTVMEQFVRELAAIHRRRVTSFISSADLAAALCADPEKPWATFTNGRRIGFHDLATLMGRLKLAPIQKQVRKGENVRGYMLAELTDLFQRYALAE
jgi:hypothetical protein